MKGIGTGKSNFIRCEKKRVFARINPILIYCATYFAPLQSSHHDRYATTTQHNTTLQSSHQDTTTQHYTDTPNTTQHYSGAIRTQQHNTTQIRPQHNTFARAPLVYRLTKEFSFGILFIEICRYGWMHIFHLHVY